VVLCHRRTTRRSNKEIERGHRIPPGYQTCRIAHLVSWFKLELNCWRWAKSSHEWNKVSTYTSARSQTVHLLSVTSSTFPSNDRFRCSSTLKHLTAYATFYFTPYKLLPRSLTTSISRYRQLDNGIDVKKHSLIVARRTHAAAVLPGEIFFCCVLPNAGSPAVA